MALARRFLLLLCGLIGAAQAETSNVSSSGFTVQFRPEVQATPAQVWASLVQIERWWSPRHSWSGQASNMSLDLSAGGCWCERWGNGAAAMHGQVLQVQPGLMLRLEAKLGPLQDLPVAGVLTLVTGISEGRTRLRATYRVAGHAEAGLDKLAAAVDGVIGEQVARLVKLIETGKPD